MADESRNNAHIRLEMLSQPRFVAGIRTLVGTVAQRLGFNEGDCGQISLAVDEALCNVINHGYDRKPTGRIWLSIWATEEPERGMRIQIDDVARQVDPATIKSRDLDDIRPGGLGVHIIKQVMDSAHYEQRPEGGMRLTLYKKMNDEDVEKQEAREARTAQGETTQHGSTTKEASP